MDDCASSHGMRIVRWGPSDAASMGMGCSHSIGRVHNDGWNLLDHAHPANDDKVLEEGMVITIEPMLTDGNGKGHCDGSSTQWSSDGALVTSWVHVVAITSDGPDVVDLRVGEVPPDAELLAAYAPTPRSWRRSKAEGSPHRINRWMHDHLRRRWSPRHRACGSSSSEVRPRCSG